MKAFLPVALLALSLSAYGQTAPSTPPSGSDGSSSSPATPSPGARVRERFEEADTNHDGKLSREEAQAMPFVAKHFDEIDTNHDGFITREELRAARQRMKADREQRSGGQSSGSTPPSSPGDPGTN